MEEGEKEVCVVDMMGAVETIQMLCSHTVPQACCLVDPIRTENPLAPFIWRAVKILEGNWLAQLGFLFLVPNEPRLLSSRESTDKL